MQFNYHCPHCHKDTPHNIKRTIEQKDDFTISEVQCSKCLDAPFNVSHETNRLPLHSSKRLPILEEEERGKKEVQMCSHCLKDTWGRSKKKIEDDKLKIVIFTCFTCSQPSEIIVPKRKKEDEHGSDEE